MNSEMFEAFASRDSLFLELNSKKEPLHGSWNENNAIGFELAKKSSNVVGMMCGGSVGDVVIDCDIKKKTSDDRYVKIKEWEDKATEFVAQFFQILPTRIIRTPSGGFHIYVRNTGKPLFEEGYRKISVPFPIEIRGGKKQSYVVAVGQTITYPIPGTYEIYKNNDIAKVTPAKLFEILEQCGVILPDLSGSGDDWNAGLKWIRSNGKNEKELRKHLESREHFSNAKRAYQDHTIKKLLATEISSFTELHRPSEISDNIDELEITYTKNDNFSLVDFDTILKYYSDNSSHKARPNFPEVNSALPITGDKNLPTRLACYYFISTASFKPVTLQEPRPHDTRIHLNMIAPLGNGKTTTLNSMTRMLKETNGSRIKRVKISHPQQLIGTYSSDKKEPKFIPGYVHERVLAIDEAEKIINEETDLNSETMAILRQAQDTYGFNKIDTKLVKIDSSLIDSQPYPQVQTLYLSHPEEYSQSATKNGTLRRTFSCEPKSENVVESDDFGIALKTTIAQKLILHPVYEHTSLKYREEDKELIDIVYKALIVKCSTSKNERIRNYISTVYHSVSELILKIVSSLHIINGLAETNEEITVCALCDFICMFDENLKVLSKYAKTDLFFSQWGEVDVQQARSLKVLLDNKNISPETGLSTAKFKQIIANIYGCDVERTVRRHISALKEKGLITQKQIGQHSHVTFLTRIPEMKEFKFTSNFWEVLEKRIDNAKGISARVDREDIVWDTLTNYLHTSQLKNLYLFNYIKEKGASNLALPVLPDLKLVDDRVDNKIKSSSSKRKQVPFEVRKKDFVNHLIALSATGFDEDDLLRLSKNDKVTLDLKSNLKDGNISHFNGKYKLENAELLKGVREA